MKYEIIETGSGTFVPVYNEKDAYGVERPRPIIRSDLGHYYVYNNCWYDGIHCKTLTEAKIILSAAKKEIEERENSQVFVKTHSL